MIPGLKRGLALLRIFTRDSPQMSLTELARAMELSRPATYRLVYTLENEGFLSREAETKRYRLSSGVLALGFEFLHSQEIVKIAAPYLQELSNEAEANAHLGVLDGWEVVYLHRVVARTRLRLITNIQVGTRLPAHCTSMGRVLLSGLSEPELQEIFNALKAHKLPVPIPGSFKTFSIAAKNDRVKGVVVNKSVFDTSVMSIAAPIFNQEGTMVAAINIVGHELAMRRSGIETNLKRAVLKAAAAICRDLGYAKPVSNRRV
jgi:IclR family pca regulon transcriptional regulator